jgi:hypothetical protein
MTEAGRPPRRKPQAAFRIYQGEATIVLPDGSTIKVLNEVGSRIWDLIDGNRGATELASIIAEEFDVDTEIARRDVNEFLENLASHDMLE